MCVRVVGVTGGHWEKMRGSPLGLVIWYPPSLLIKVIQSHNQGRLHKGEELGIIVWLIFLISFNKDIFLSILLSQIFSIRLEIAPLTGTTVIGNITPQ